ncbi:hypothetical protein BD779DRAFT_219279 [Infundibulicybe gibba]|nr:hypothetical protein BD779DRAFT_219279 [Infundibulicybe gibba]
MIIFSALLLASTFTLAFSQEDYSQYDIRRDTAYVCNNPSKWPNSTVTLPPNTKVGSHIHIHIHSLDQSCLNRHALERRFHLSIISKSQHRHKRYSELTSRWDHVCSPRRTPPAVPATNCKPH